MSFPKFVTITKNTAFFQILHVFAPLNDVHAYIAYMVLKNNPNYMNFLRVMSNFKYKCPSPSPPPRIWMCVHNIIQDKAKKNKSYVSKLPRAFAFRCAFDSAKSKVWNFFACLIFFSVFYELSCQNIQEKIWQTQ